MTIGEAVRLRIIQLCQERNITVNKLSGISDITQSTANTIVSGRNNSATVSSIKKLCDGLGITIEDFFHSELFVGLSKKLNKQLQLLRLFFFSNFSRKIYLEILG